MTTITKPCIHCNETSTLTVDADGYQQRRRGAIVQDALPDMDSDNRELLISGTHPACWDAMFGEEQ